MSTRWNYNFNKVYIKKEERIKIASKMKLIGTPISEIFELTELTAEEIEQL